MSKMQTNNAAGLLPAAHMPNAIAAAGSNPNIAEQLKAMQAQLNALLGMQNQEDLADVVLVNESGRIVEVDGKAAMELLSKPGFRRASTEEEERYRKAILRQTPMYLRRMEKKRLQEEKALLDELEAEEDAAESTDDLLRAPVTDSQKSGTPAPVSTPKVQSTPVNQPTQTTDDQKTSVEKDTQTQQEESTPRPPSRRSRSVANDNSSSQEQDTPSGPSSNSQDDEEEEEQEEN
jgi:hypothetical protein